MSVLNDTQMSELLARIGSLEENIESKDRLIANLTTTVMNLQRDMEEREVENDPLGGAMDDPFRRLPTVTAAGGGATIPQFGDTQTVGGHQPHMYKGDCTGPLRLTAPEEEFTRDWGLTEWDEDDGCFYNKYDTVTISDGNVRILRTNCREKIVCAVDCTELVNPLCA